jgi:hypothetical protein
MVCTSSLIRPLSLLLCLSLPSTLPSVLPPSLSLPLSVCALSPLHLSSSLPLSLSPSLSLCACSARLAERRLPRPAVQAHSLATRKLTFVDTWLRLALRAVAQRRTCVKQRLFFLKKRCFLCLSRACLGKRNTFSSRTEVLGHHVRPERRSPVVHAAAVVIRRI